MSRLLVSLSLVILMLARAAPARAATGPVRLALACEATGRTKVCPVFLRGLMAKSSLLLDSPRSDAQVVLYVAATEVALRDRVHLRFVGELAGAPHELEIDVELDTRATDDEQIAQLAPAFLRGIALYVATVDPAAVTVTLGNPSAAPGTPPATTPWGVAVTANGNGNHSGKYLSVSSLVSANVTRIDPTSFLYLAVTASGGIERKPSLAVDGNDVSLDTTRWSLNSTFLGEHHLDDHWSLGAITMISRDDPKGQYRYAWRGSAGIEWDRFAANDPRGNVLAIAYGLGWQIDGYNFPDALGERFAQYPAHRLAAAGRVRRDKVTYGLNLSIDGEVLHPLRRHSISGSPTIDLQLGTHVDLSLSVSLTKRELPEPQIPADDFEAISRGDYAAPFAATGALSITVHWDRTNGAQNDRFQQI